MSKKSALLKYLLLALFIGSVSSVQAQTGTITGQVTNSRNQPLASINISLQGTTYGAATNTNGFYEIEEVPAGSYTFVVSGIGYETERKPVTLNGGETLRIDVVLATSNEELQKIVVQGSRINKFSVNQSEYVAKLPIKNIDNPQVYNTITSELLEDQVITSFDDALQNAPGVFKLWESTGRGGDGAGYYSLRGFPVQPTMVNGLPSLTNGTLNPANIERIEIIKGPSGTLYGSSLISYGGLINVVTKKPYNFFGGEVSYKTGSFGLNRITADVNTPVGLSEQAAVRVIGAYHTQNSFQDAGFNKSFFVAPSLSYSISDKLSFLVQTEYQHTEGTNPTMLFLNRSAALVADNLQELSYDYNNSYTSNDITISNPTFSLQGQMKYQLSDRWISQTVLSRSSAKTDGYYTYLWDLADGNGTYARYLSKQNSTTLGTDIQQNFIGNVNLGGLNHKMVVGFDYFQENVINNSTGYVGLGQISLNEENPSGISRAAADAALEGATVTMGKTRQSVYSAYVSDVVTFSPYISAMASLRIDHFVNTGSMATDEDNFKQTALSPKFGLVLQPIPDRLSLFANYMNGFSNVAPRIQDDGSTKTFSPEQANQWESGVKANLYNGRLTATISYYNILVSNVVREDPDRMNFYIQDGENYSRGLELSLTAAPLPGLNVVAGYSHNLSKVTKTGNTEYLGRRPESAGPQDLINGWVSYRISSGTLNGLGLGFGGNYASENLILNRASTGTFALPSYTILNASIFYDTPEFRVDLKVNNLSDVEYYKGWSTINPQEPRNITASFSYKF